MSKYKNRSIEQETTNKEAKSQLRNYVKAIGSLFKLDPSHREDNITVNLAYFHEINNPMHYVKDQIKKVQKFWRNDPKAEKNFNKYLAQLENNPGDIKNTELNKIILSNPTKKVTYPEQINMDDLKIHFANDGLIYRGKETTPYNTVGHQDGRATLVDQQGKSKEAISDNPDEAAFVVQRGEIYAKHHIAGVFQHTSMTAGKPISCAGLIEVTNGKIKKMTNKSGHYTVPPEKYAKFIKSIDKKYFADDVKIVMEHKPCYFAQLLDSDSNMFIHKFGETLNKNFIDKSVYSKNDIDHLEKEALSYKFNPTAESITEKVNGAIGHAIASDKNLKPRDGEANKDFHQRLILEHGQEYHIEEIRNLSQNIINITKTIQNSETLHNDEKKELHNQLSKVFHLKMENLVGNKDLGNKAKEAVKLFTERTLNQVNDQETRKLLRTQINELYLDSTGTYIKRDKASSQDVKPVSAILCTEMPNINHLEKKMDNVIKSMNDNGYELLGQQFKQLLELKNCLRDGESGKELIPRSEFNEKMGIIKKNIEGNPQLVEFSTKFPDLKNDLDPPIFDYKTDKVEDSLLDKFVDQAESIRLANLRHIAKKGETLDKTAKFRSHLPKAGDIEGEKDYTLRCKAAEEVIRCFCDENYLQSMLQATIANKDPNKSNVITLLRPTKDYDKASNSYNTLTNMTASILAEELNRVAIEQKKDISFEVGTTQMLTTTNRTDADPIGRLIKQPFFNDKSNIANKNVIIFDDHAQAGAFTATLTNFAKEHNAKVVAVSTLTAHPSSASSIYANKAIVDELKTMVYDEGNHGKPFDQKKSVENLESLLNGQGMSLDTLTNSEALILCVLFSDKNQVDKLKKLESIATNGVKIQDGQKDSLVDFLSKQEHRYSVKSLSAEINKRLRDGARVTIVEAIKTTGNRYNVTNTSDIHQDTTPGNHTHNKSKGV